MKGGRPRVVVAKQLAEKVQCKQDVTEAGLETLEELKAAPGVIVPIRVVPDVPVGEVTVEGTVEAKARANQADLAVTLIHEYAHVLLHFDVDDEDERSKREVEAEAVAYIVGRYCGLDTSDSAFYLAAWKSDDPEVVRDRLDKISRTAEQIIDVLEE